MQAFLKNLDWKLNLAVLFLLVAGSISLYSSKPELFYKQLVFILISLVLVFIFLQFDWRSFINYRGVVMGLYVLGVALLALTLLVAPEIRGAKSWIPLGSFQFQASEFVNLVLIVVLANFFRKMHKSIGRASIIIYSFAYFAVMAFLILLQPDLGSAIMLFLVWAGFVLVSGIRWRHLAIGFFILILLSGLAWQYGLKGYQKERIAGLFFPGRDVLGINYNVIQSKIAIGSAGLFGKGFRQGTQVQLGFLPEAQTDFIFASIVEEWGIISGFLLLAAFMYLILRIIKIGLSADSNFGKFSCLGIAILFCANFFFNIGSNLGLTPVVGVPFPFLSYGGSHLLFNLAALGMAQSIKVGRL